MKIRSFNLSNIWPVRYQSIVFIAHGPISLHIINHLFKLYNPRQYNNMSIQDSKTVYKIEQSGEDGSRWGEPGPAGLSADPEDKLEGEVDSFKQSHQSVRHESLQLPNVLESVHLAGADKYEEEKVADDHNDKLILSKFACSNECESKLDFDVDQKQSQRNNLYRMFSGSKIGNLDNILVDDLHVDEQIVHSNVNQTVSKLPWSHVPQHCGSPPQLKKVSSSMWAEQKMKSSQELTSGHQPQDICLLVSPKSTLQSSVSNNRHCLESAGQRSLLKESAPMVSEHLLTLQKVYSGHPQAPKKLARAATLVKTTSMRSDEYKAMMTKKPPFRGNQEQFKMDSSGHKSQILKNLGSDKLSQGTVDKLEPAIAEFDMGKPDELNLRQSKVQMSEKRPQIRHLQIMEKQRSVHGSIDSCLVQIKDQNSTQERAGENEGVSKVKINDAGDLIKLLCPRFGGNDKLGKDEDGKASQQDVHQQSQPEFSSKTAQDQADGNKNDDQNSKDGPNLAPNNQSVRMILPNGQEVLLDFDPQALLTNFNKGQMKAEEGQEKQNRIVSAVDVRSIDSETPMGQQPGSDDKDQKGQQDDSQQIEETQGGPKSVHSSPKSQQDNRQEEYRSKGVAENAAKDQLPIFKREHSNINKLKFQGSFSKFFDNYQRKSNSSFASIEEVSIKIPQGGPHILPNQKGNEKKQKGALEQIFDSSEELDLLDDNFDPVEYNKLLKEKKQQIQEEQIVEKKQQKEGLQNLSLLAADLDQDLLGDLDESRINLKPLENDRNAKEKAQQPTNASSTAKKFANHVKRSKVLEKFDQKQEPIAPTSLQKDSILDPSLLSAVSPVRNHRDLDTIPEEQNGSSRTMTESSLAGCRRSSRRLEVVVENVKNREDQMEQEMNFKQALCGPVEKHSSINPVHHHNKMSELDKGPSLRREQSMFQGGLNGIKPLFPLSSQEGSNGNIMSLPFFSNGSSPQINNHASPKCVPPEQNKMSSLSRTDSSMTNGIITINRSANLNSVPRREHRRTESNESLAFQSPEARSLPSGSSAQTTECLERIHQQGWHDLSQKQIEDVLRPKYHQFNKMQKNELIQKTLEQFYENIVLRQRIQDIMLFLRRKYCIDDDDQLLMEMNKLDENINRQQHLTFMFASPLVMQRHNSDEYLEIDQLDCPGEWANLRKALSNNNKSIKIRKICGTLKNLSSTLDEGTLVLHFSGHGQMEDAFKYSEFGQIRNQGDILILEKEDGTQSFLSKQQLKEVLNKKTDIKLVFVASCHSEQTGWTFHEAGIGHVICTRRETPIKDAAQKKFTERFYQHLFSDELSICDAFHKAQQFIENDSDPSISGEAYKFIIIRPKDKPYNVKNGKARNEFYQRILQNAHDCNCKSIGAFVKGKLQLYGEDDANQQLFKYRKTDLHMIGRLEKVCEIVKCLQEERLVTVIGFHGVGKGTLIRKVAFHLNERKVFEDGIIHVSVKGKRQPLQTILYREIVGQLSMDTLNQMIEYKIGRKRTQLIKKQMEMEDEQANKDALRGYENLRSIINILEDKRVLIILDSIEGAIEMRNDAFRSTLEEILNCCPYVKILTTSRRCLNQIGDFTEKLVYVGALSSLDSVRLFFDQARSKNQAFDKKAKDFNEQILSLIFQDAHVKRLFEKANKPIQRMPLSELYLLLSEHPLFKSFDGHPQAIRLVASMTMDHTLAELYQVVTSKGFSLGQKFESHPFHSLVGAQEAAITHLNKIHPNAVKLFILVGMMPAGIIDADLENIWGKNWEFLARILIDRDLIRKKELAHNVDVGQKTNFKYMLLPFMNISSFLPNFERDGDELHRRINAYFLQLMREFGDSLQSGESNESHQRNRYRLRFHEENLRASFERTVAHLKPKAEEPGKPSQQVLQRRMPFNPGKNSEPGSFKKQENEVCGRTWGDESIMAEVQKGMAAKAERGMKQSKRSSAIKKSTGPAGIGAERQSTMRESQDRGKQSGQPRPPVSKPGTTSSKFRMAGQTQNSGSAAMSSVKKASLIEKDSHQRKPKAKKGDRGHIIAPMAADLTRGDCNQLLVHASRGNAHSQFMGTQPQSSQEIQINKEELIEGYLSESQDIMELRGDLFWTRGREGTESLRNSEKAFKAQAAKRRRAEPPLSQASDVAEQARAERQASNFLSGEHAFQEDEQMEPSSRAELGTAHHQIMHQRQVQELQGKQGRPLPDTPDLTAAPDCGAGASIHHRGTRQDRDHKTNEAEDLELPDEAQLLLCYLGTLILSRNFEQAAEISRQYGLIYQDSYDFEDEEVQRPSFQASIKKLMACTLFCLHTKVREADSLLEEAQAQFAELGIDHGTATCAFARALFRRQSSGLESVEERKRIHVDELRLAEQHGRTGLEYYERMDHPLGQAKCLELLLTLKVREHNDSGVVLPRGIHLIGQLPDSQAHRRDSSWEKEAAERLHDLEKALSQQAPRRISQFASWASLEELQLILELPRLRPSRPNGSQQRHLNTKPGGAEEPRQVAGRPAAPHLKKARVSPGRLLSAVQRGDTALAEHEERSPDSVQYKNRYGAEEVLRSEEKIPEDAAREAEAIAEYGEKHMERRARGSYTLREQRYQTKDGMEDADGAKARGKKGAWPQRGHIIESRPAPAAAEREGGESVGPSVALRKLEKKPKPTHGPGLSNTTKAKPKGKRFMSPFLGQALRQPGAVPKYNEGKHGTLPSYMDVERSTKRGQRQKLDIMSCSNGPNSEPDDQQESLGKRASSLRGNSGAQPPNALLERRGQPIQNNRKDEQAPGALPAPDRYQSGVSGIGEEIAAGSPNMASDLCSSRPASKVYSMAGEGARPASPAAGGERSTDPANPAEAHLILKDHEAAQPHIILEDIKLPGRPLTQRFHRQGQSLARIRDHRRRSRHVEQMMPQRHKARRIGEQQENAQPQRHDRAQGYQDRHVMIPGSELTATESTPCSSDLNVSQLSTEEAHLMNNEMPLRNVRRVEDERRVVDVDASDEFKKIRADEADRGEDLGKHSGQENQQTEVFNEAKASDKLEEERMMCPIDLSERPQADAKAKNEQGVEAEANSTGRSRRRRSKSFAPLQSGDRDVEEVGPAPCEAASATAPAAGVGGPGGEDPGARTPEGQVPGPGGALEPSMTSQRARPLNQDDAAAPAERSQAQTEAAIRPSSTISAIQQQLIPHEAAGATGLRVGPGDATQIHQERIVALAEPKQGALEELAAKDISIGSCSESCGRGRPALSSHSFKDIVLARQGDTTAELAPEDVIRLFDRPDLAEGCPVSDRVEAEQSRLSGPQRGIPTSLYAMYRAESEVALKEGARSQMIDFLDSEGISYDTRPQHPQSRPPRPQQPARESIVADSFPQAEQLPLVMSKLPQCQQKKRMLWQRRRQFIKNVIADVPDQIKEQSEEEERGHSEGPCPAGDQQLPIAPTAHDMIDVSKHCTTRGDDQDLENDAGEHDRQEHQLEIQGRGAAEGQAKPRHRPEKPRRAPFAKRSNETTKKEGKHMNSQMSCKTSHRQMRPPSSLNSSGVWSRNSNTRIAQFATAPAGAKSKRSFVGRSPPHQFEECGGDSLSISSSRKSSIKSLAKKHSYRKGDGQLRPGRPRAQANPKMIKFEVQWRSDSSVLIRGQILIELVREDLADQRTDAIVGSPDELLDDGMGEGGPCVLKGGVDRLQEGKKYSRKNDAVAVSGCTLENSGTLPSIQLSIKSSLDRAKKLKGVQSISLPPVRPRGSTGGPDAAPPAVLQACLRWCMQKDTGGLRTIRLCTADEREHLAYLQQLERIGQSRACPGRFGGKT